MKKKISKGTFWSGLGLATASLISSLALMVISPGSKTDNLPPPPQESRSLVTNQQKSINKSDETIVPIEKLKFEPTSDGTGYEVSGFKNPKEIKYGCEVKIPKTYNGKPVTACGYSAFKGEEGKDDSGGGKINRIDFGDVAYSGSFFESGIKSATFSEKIINLVDFTFHNCYELLAVTIPGNKFITQSISNGVFLFNEEDLRPDPERHHRRLPALRKVIFLSNGNIDFDRNWFGYSEGRDPDRRHYADDAYIYAINDTVKSKILETVPQDFRRENVRVASIVSDFIEFNDEGLTELIGLNTSAKEKTNITIPANIDKIDVYSFFDRSDDLAYITFPENCKISTIYDDAFESIPKKTKYRISTNKLDSPFFQLLRSVSYVNDERILSYKVADDFFVQCPVTGSEPSNPTELGGIVDSSLAKTNLTIPKCATKIDAGAFKGCSPKLESIDFPAGNHLGEIAKTDFDGVPSGVKYFVHDETTANKLLNAGISDVYSPPTVVGDFIFGKKWTSNGKGTTSLIGLSEQGKTKKTLTVDQTGGLGEINFIGASAFKNHHPSLSRVSFANENISFDPNALKDLGRKIVYYVDSDNKSCQTINNLITSQKIDKTKIYLKTNNTLQDFITRKNYADDHLKALVGLNESTFINSNQLTVPNDIAYIDTDAFQRLKTTVKTITFELGSKLSGVGADALKDDQLTSAQYLFKPSDLTIASLLKDGGASDHQIIVSGDIFNIDITGILTRVNKLPDSTKPKLNDGKLNGLVIPKELYNKAVVGIGTNAFSNVSTVSRIEFTNGINLDANKIDTNAFAGLRETSVLFAYDFNSATTLAKKWTKAVGVAVGNFFCKINEQNQLLGLTENGRSQTKLDIPETINFIDSNAFFNCSDKLDKIIIHSRTLTLANDAFGSIPQNVLKKLKFEVLNNTVKGTLLSKGIGSDSITVLATPGGRTIKADPPYLTIGVGVGSTALAVIILGLGIGLPMRKQHKINLLNTKLTHKRIDKLSAANALAFKKVVEATGEIKKEMHLMSTDMKALKSASPAPAKPKVDTTGFKPTPNSPVKPATKSTNTKSASSTSPSSKPPVEK